MQMMRPVLHEADERKPKEMKKSHRSPFERGRKSGRDLNHDPDEVKIQIGSCYYWIRMSRGTIELCRAPVRNDGLVLHEVLQHDNLGITDDDLEDAVRLEGGDPDADRELHISSHIKGKLQILYAP